jgi:hypothetical protein
MRVRIRPTAVACLVSFAAATLGCGGAKYDTPEATFQTMRVAANNKDMRGMFDCMTDESLEVMAGMLVLVTKTPFGAAAFKGSLSAADAQKAQEAAAAVCDKHGATDDAIKDKTANPMALLGADGIRSLAAVVDDKAAFIADMWNALQPFGQLSKFSDDFTTQLSGELKDVNINGDQATAVVVMKNGQAPLTFRKTPNGWKLHWQIDPMGLTAPPA